MFERFTQQARQVVVWAQEEARGLQDNLMILLNAILAIDLSAGAGALDVAPQLIDIEPELIQSLRGR